MESTERRSAIPHISALDGARGAAVAGVLLFHGGHLLGGYLGVDFFFTLSGFLITSLLLAESSRTGGIRLGSFWARRARRLLPALAVLMVAVALYSWGFAARDELAQIRGDAFATLGLYRQLARDLFAPGLLHALHRSVAAQPHVEPRDRGAVLRDLAAALRRAPDPVQAGHSNGRAGDVARLGRRFERAR